MSKLIIKNKEGIYEEINVDYKKIQKMASIYYALENNYTVKKIQENKYEYTKEGSKIIVDKFSKNHLNTYKILK